MPIKEKVIQYQELETHWFNRNDLADIQRQTTIHIAVIIQVNLKFQIHSNAWIWSVGGSQSTWRTYRHGSKLHRDPGDSVTEASCCEAIMINTATQCNIKKWSMCLNKRIQFRRFMREFGKNRKLIDSQCQHQIMVVLFIILQPLTLRYAMQRGQDQLQPSRLNYGKSLLI